MTVASTTNRKTFAGDDATTSFGTSPVVFFGTADLTVYVTDDVTGVATLLVENTDYTVTGGDGSTGTVSLAGGNSPWGVLVSNTTLVIVRELDLVQEANPENNDNSDADVIETALDKLTMMVQQVSAKIDRAFTLEDSDVSGVSTVLPVPVASELIGWNAAKTALVGYAAASISDTIVPTAFAATLLDDSTAAEARATLGSTSVGDALFIAASAAAARSALDISSEVGFIGMINGTIVASRAAGAETIAIKTLAGADPSASDPVIFIFRNATAGTGDYVSLTATAALSVTISSGSTMGATNSVPFRLWLTVFNDASTLRLGVVKCLSGTSIMALKDDDLNSSTAEGGAGAADSAQVIYTGTAVTTKAMRVLGYLEYTLAAVGTWDTAPSKTQLFGPGAKLPGDSIQAFYTQKGAVATGTTVLPMDDTIPQNTEGIQWMTQAITPTSACNVLEVDVLTIQANTEPGYLTAALFQDSTTGALAAAVQSLPSPNLPVITSFLHEMVAGTVSSTTMKVRGGGSAAGTTTFNGAASGRYLGGVMASHIKVTEIMA